MNRVFDSPILGCKPTGYYTNQLVILTPLRVNTTLNLYQATCALEIAGIVSSQRTLRYLYNEVQKPLTIVAWTMVVNTIPAWEMEYVTRAMSPNHLAKVCSL